MTMLKLIAQVPFLQHFIFFVTYEWVQYDRAFVPANPFQLLVAAAKRKKEAKLPWKMWH
jgi:hypothetical protein